MTPLLAAAGAAAVGDWWAVAAGRRRTEYVLKPLVPALLVAAALALEPRVEAQRAWFAVALALSLAGDVFLMLPADRFVAGLASFLLAHVAYAAGFLEVSPSPEAVAVAAVGAGVALATLGRHIATRAPRALRAPVVAYMVVLSAMVVLAIASGSPWGAAGGLLFYVSDGLIGWRRFVAERRWMPVAVIVTYHLAQGALVVSLAR